jgi:hypothetical protein
VRQAPVSLILSCALGLYFAPPPRSWAQEDGSTEVIAADILLVRPLCLAATMIGTELFVVSRPISITTKSTDQTAYKLVSEPARATFTRHLGDMSILADR